VVCESQGYFAPSHREFLQTHSLSWNSPNSLQRSQIVACGLRITFVILAPANFGPGGGSPDATTFWLILLFFACATLQANYAVRRRSTRIPGKGEFCSLNTPAPEEMMSTRTPTARLRWRPTKLGLEQGLSLSEITPTMEITLIFPWEWTYGA